MDSHSVRNLGKQHARVVACTHAASNRAAPVDCWLAAPRRRALGTDARQPAQRSCGRVCTLAAVAESMTLPALQKPTFVEVLRGAAPYVQSHRNSTCVVCLPSKVSRACLDHVPATCTSLGMLRCRMLLDPLLLPMQVMMDKQLLNSVLSDLVLLHSGF